VLLINKDIHVSSVFYK